MCTLKQTCFLFKISIPLKVIKLFFFCLSPLQVVLKSEHNAFRCSIQLRKYSPRRGRTALGNLELSEGNWVDCLGQERISLEQTHCLFISLFFTPLDHSVPAVSNHLGAPPSPWSLLLEDRGVEIGTKWRDGMRATEGTILIKMFAQKIISRVALLIMTNACKGSTRKTHGVWGCSPWKRVRTVFYPPQTEVGRLSSSFCSSLKQLVWPPGDVTLLLIGSLPSLQRTDSSTLMWNPRWAVAQHKHTLIHTVHMCACLYTHVHISALSKEKLTEELNAD